MLESFSHVNDRIFITDQVFREFSKNFISVKPETYKEIQKELTGMSKDLEQLIIKCSSYSISLPPELQDLRKIKRLLEQTLRKLENLVQDEARENNPELFLNKYADLFDGKLLPKKTEDWFHKHEKIAVKRYDQKVPPGYRDSPKTVNQYGDYFFWQQCIEHCSELKKDLLLITNDVKEDWYLRIDGKTLGPRRELCEEFRELTGCEVWLYSLDNFVKRVSQKYKLNVGTSVISEITATSSAQSRPGKLLEAMLGNLVSGDKYERLCRKLGLSSKLAALLRQGLPINGLDDDLVLELIDPSSEGPLAIPAQVLNDLKKASYAVDSISPSGVGLGRSLLGEEFFKTYNEPNKAE